MSFPLRYATLMDGAFVVRKLAAQLRRFPSGRDIELLGAAIDAHECVSDYSRLRVYFYHARPSSHVLVNPISKQRLALESTFVYSNHVALLASLEHAPDFALRLGETMTIGWKVGPNAFRAVMRAPRILEADDLVPAIVQKGVDLRIGLDIARLALTRSVQAIFAVTGDSDLVPAFKFARREGIRVFLCTLGHGVQGDLLAHADRVIQIDSTARARTTNPPDAASTLDPSCRLSIRTDGRRVDPGASSGPSL